MHTPLDRSPQGPCCLVPVGSSSTRCDTDPGNTPFLSVIGTRLLLPTKFEKGSEANMGLWGFTPGTITILEGRVQSSGYHSPLIVIGVSVKAARSSAHELYKGDRALRDYSVLWSRSHYSVAVLRMPYYKYNFAVYREEFLPDESASPFPAAKCAGARLRHGSSGILKRVQN